MMKVFITALIAFIAIGIFGQYDWSSIQGFLYASAQGVGSPLPFPFRGATSSYGPQNRFGNFPQTGYPSPYGKFPQPGSPNQAYSRPFGNYPTPGIQRPFGNFPSLGPISPGYTRPFLNFYPPGPPPSSFEDFHSPSQFIQRWSHFEHIHWQSQYGLHRPEYNFRRSYQYSLPHRPRSGHYRDFYNIYRGLEFNSNMGNEVAKEMESTNDDFDGRSVVSPGQYPHMVS